MSEVTVNGIVYESFVQGGCECCIAYDREDDPDHKLCESIYVAHGNRCTGIQWKEKMNPARVNEEKTELQKFIQWFDDNYDAGQPNTHPWILNCFAEDDADHTMAEVYESYLEFLKPKTQEQIAIEEAIKLLETNGYEVKGCH